MDYPILMLHDSDAGRYFVNTEHSSYVIDLDGKTLKRVPRSPEASDLRGDEHEVDLMSIRKCEVGHHAVFQLTGLAPEVPTLRMTTLVHSIEVAA